MTRRKLAKWCAMLSSTAFLAIPGCESVSGIMDALLGVLGGA